MVEKFDTIDSLLSSYVAGSLPQPLQVLMASQLELSNKHHALVDGLESAAGDELEQLEPEAVTDRDDALAAIFAFAGDDEQIVVGGEKKCAVMPKALQDFIGHSVDDIPWKTKMPGFKEFDLPDIDGCHVSMFWIKPGRTVPMHTHEGMELSLIIQGAFTDERGRFGKGDISIADQDVEHRPTAEMDEPCIGFAVTDGALRLTGPLHQRIGDILGMA